MKTAIRILAIIGLGTLVWRAYPYIASSRILTNLVCAYLLAGLIVSAIIDYTIRRILTNQGIQYRNFDRIVVILLWPVVVINSLLSKKD
jgi:multisubunit Na+/H+ antiporter MnhE subunit